MVRRPVNEGDLRSRPPRRGAQRDVEPRPVNEGDLRSRPPLRSEYSDGPPFSEYRPRNPYSRSRSEEDHAHRRPQYFALIVTLAAIGAVCLAILYDREWVAAIFGGGALVSLAAVFLRRR